MPKKIFIILACLNKNKSFFIRAFVIYLRWNRREAAVLQRTPGKYPLKGNDYMDISLLTRDCILRCAMEQFGTEPEYLWPETPDCAVLRHADSRKWYALLMEVPCARLGLPGDGQMDTLTLKCDPVLIGALRTRKGFLPAYHMNKEHWLTLCLDGSVSEEEGLSLLEMSFALTQKKMKKASKAAKGHQKENGGITP